MARYNTLPDGSTLVATDDGRKIRTAVPPDALATSFDMQHDPTLGPDEIQGNKLTDLMGRLQATRAKYDQDFAAASQMRSSTNDAQAKKDTNRSDYDSFMQQLDERERLRRAEELSGATSELSLARPGAGYQPTATDATRAGPSSGPLNIATDAQVAAAQKAGTLPRERVQFAPDTTGAQGRPSMASYAAEQSAQGGGDPVAQSIADFALKNAVKRTGPTKGGWTPRSQTVETNAVPPPDYLEGVDRAEMGEEKVALANREKAAAGYREQVVAPQLAALEQDLGALDAAYARRQRYDAELGKLRKNAEDTERAANEMKTVSPTDDFFDHHGGVFGRILAAVAMGAGAFASGMGGMPNTAMQVMNGAIAEHAQTLKEKHDRAVAAGKDARNAYSDALKMYGDPESAIQALNLKGEVLADKMLKVNIGRHASAQENAALDQWLEQRKVARAQRWADVAGKAAGRVVSSAEYRPGSAGGVSVDRNMLELGLKARAQATKEAGGDELSLRKDINARERAVRLAPEDARRLGTPELYAGDKDEKKRAQEAIAYNNRGLTAINRIKEIIQTDNWETNPDLAAEMGANGAALQAYLSKPLSLSQQTKEELESLTGKLKGAEAAQWGRLDSEALKSLDTAERLFNEDKSEWMRTMTRSPFRPDYAEPDVQTRSVR